MSIKEYPQEGMKRLLVRQVNEPTRKNEAALRNMTMNALRHKEPEYLNGPLPVAPKRPRGAAEREYDESQRLLNEILDVRAQQLTDSAARQKTDADLLYDRANEAVMLDQAKLKQEEILAVQTESKGEKFRKSRIEKAIDIMSKEIVSEIKKLPIAEQTAAIAAAPAAIAAVLQQNGLDATAAAEVASVPDVPDALSDVTRRWSVAASEIASQPETLSDVASKPSVPSWFDEFPGMTAEEAYNAAMERPASEKTHRTITHPSLEDEEGPGTGAPPWFDEFPGMTAEEAYHAAMERPASEKTHKTIIHPSLEDEQEGGPGTGAPGVEEGVEEGYETPRPVTTAVKLDTVLKRILARRDLELSPEAVRLKNIYDTATTGRPDPKVSEMRKELRAEVSMQIASNPSVLGTLKASERRTIMDGLEFANRGRPLPTKRARGQKKNSSSKRHK